MGKGAIRKIHRYRIHVECIPMRVYHIHRRYRVVLKLDLVRLRRLVDHVVVAAKPYG